MTRLTKALLCCSALLIVSSVHADDKLPAEVMHSWTSGGEAAAVKVIIDEFNARGGEWSDASIAGFESANAAYTSRILSGNPPTARSVIFGLDQRELMEQGLLNNVDAVATAGKWPDAVPANLYATLGYDGHIYLAPISMHGESWMFYSKPVFDKVGIAAEPASWDEFFADMDKIKAAGLVPIAWGGQAWQEVKVFNAILLSQVGVEGFGKVYAGDEATLKSDGFKKTVEIFGKMRDYVDASSPGRNWNDATAMVISGKAGVQFMGDWAKGEFINAGKTLGTDYGCALAPGSDGMVIIGDAMAFPKTGKAEQDKAQALLAEVIMDPKIQVEFAKKKGSFPVRKDVDTSSLDACAQKGVALLAAGKVAPEHAIIITPAKVGAVTDLIGEFWANPAMSGDEVVEKFTAAVTEG
ncbi:sugar ABC transporter [Kaistia algarum]|uniref:ABC transporter substrate-binding protein n=1 Tax=Kaistia algarum TaxID=2083279 RepID=UPI000CE8475A|nr:ABC transporter substrate-binding protein [Kaistia algarum]MCX5513047.1 ABC transporter substrate-binding protein [Kaistia algarum]PPE81473.1 sugar ABC transporter [Kaistia algarum]